MSSGTPIEIAYWLGTLRHEPTVDEIQQRWNLSRNSAFRWRAFLRSGGRSQSPCTARSESQRWRGHARREH